MEDSIYRDLYWAVDQIQIWWRIVSPYLASPFAIRLYIITSCLITLGNSLLLALSAKLKLTDIKNESFKFTFPGPHPENEDKIAKRREVLEEKAAEVWRPYYWSALSLLVFGLVIPLMGFILICANYVWLDTNHVPFVNIVTRTQIQTPDVMTFLIFVIDQISRGALFDTLEVFNYNVSMITNNSNNYLFSTIVLTFRLNMSVFSGALIVAVVEAVQMRRQIKSKFDEQINIYKREAEEKRQAKARNIESRAA